MCPSPVGPVSTSVSSRTPGPVADAKPGSDTDVGLDGALARDLSVGARPIEGRETATFAFDWRRGLLDKAVSSLVLGAGWALQTAVSIYRKLGQTQPFQGPSTRDGSL